MMLPDFSRHNIVVVCVYMFLCLENEKLSALDLHSLI